MRTLVAPPAQEEAAHDTSPRPEEGRHVTTLAIGDDGATWFGTTYGTRWVER